MSEFETIVATLGVERSASLFHSILPLINVRRYELIECLSHEDWESASQYAHKLLATGHLLNSSALIAQLILIEKREISVIREPDFIQQLVNKFDSSLQQLMNYSQTNLHT